MQIPFAENVKIPSHSLLIRSARARGRSTESDRQRRISLASYFLCTLLFLLSITSASAASFDCAKARSNIEKLICSDPALSKIDEEMNAAYKKALAATSEKATVKEWQRDWLKSTAIFDCKDADCLRTEFSARIQLLHTVASVGAPEAVWTGKYVRYEEDKEDINDASIFLVGLTGRAIYVWGTALWQDHTGELNGTGKLVKNYLKYDRDGCRAKMKLKGKMLIVENEPGCGGFNVTFNGTYKKQ